MDIAPVKFLKTFQSFNPGETGGLNADLAVQLQAAGVVRCLSKAAHAKAVAELTERNAPTQVNRKPSMVFLDLDGEVEDSVPLPEPNYEKFGVKGPEKEARKGAPLKK